MAKGRSVLDATHMAYAAIHGTVQKQSILLSYIDSYWVVGIAMLCAIPLVFWHRLLMGKKQL